MKKEHKTTVLIVGAGPVGMLTAIFLAESGVDVQIIDEEGGPTTQSGACGLHSRSLGFLDRAGLLEPILGVGRRIDTIKLYEGADCFGEVHLSELPSQHPYALAISQGDLERLLEHRLYQINQQCVLWKHRLSGLELANDGVIAAVEKLRMSSGGVIMAVEELIVHSEQQIRAEFVVCTDGKNSTGRRACNISNDSLGARKLFLVCDTEPDPGLGNQAGIILDDEGAGLLWPLPGNKCRWVLENSQLSNAADTPVKQRTRFVVRGSEEEKLEFQQILTRRAPWFTQSVTEIDLATELAFAPRLARQFGCGRCWLAGDAAHQTGPIGMQSMNAGLADAAELADALKAILQQNASEDLLKSYEQSRREELNFLGGQRAFHPGSQTPHETGTHWENILACLPALGEDLEILLGQLGVGDKVHAGPRTHGRH